MNTLFTIGIFLAFFLQFLLLSKKGKSVSDVILAVWMFVFGSHFFSYYLYSNGYWELYPHLVGIHHPVPLLYGPLLYLYVVFSLPGNRSFSVGHLMHFLPPLGAYLYMIPFFFFYTEEQKRLINEGVLDDYEIFMTLSLFAFFLSGIGYAIASYRLVGNYRQLTDQNFGYRESIDLNWLKFFIWGIGGIFVMVGFIILLTEVGNLSFGFNPDYIFYSLLIGFVFFLGTSGIRHQTIFSGKAEEDTLIVQPKPTGEYERSGLKEEDARMYHKALNRLMETKKPYLEPKITLRALADELDLSPNHLSQIINQKEGKNFFDYVNSYRVNEFKRRLLHPENQHFSLLSIALDSGFNSKSSFNQVFKKFEGKTPSQYQKERLSQS